MTRRLLILSFSTIASDARVLKQVRLFGADPAYEVTTCGYGPSPDASTGVAHHITIPDEAVYWQRSRALTIARLYERAYWSSPAVRFAWKALGPGSGTERFDAVLADDIDSVGLALALAPRNGVHADLHEYSPREKEDVPRWRLFVAPYMRWQARHYVTRAASTTTVGQHIAEEYEKVFGLHPGVVTNATPYAELEPTPVPPEGQPIRVVHSGAAREDRYLEVMIDAVAALPERYSLDMYLTPNNPAYLDGLKERTAALPNVTVHDGVPYAELIATLNQYDLGVHILPPVNFNNEWALPNKLFDFVQARLGVVIGPSPEMARVVEGSGVGAVAAGFTAKDLTTALDGLSREDVARFKSASHAHAHDLSSEETSQGWKRAVDALFGGPARA